MAQYHKLTEAEYIDILTIHAPFFNRSLNQMMQILPLAPNQKADVNRFIDVVNSTYLEGKYWNE